jgi:hypothetical protein
MDTTPKDIQDGELTEDLEVAPKDAEDIKGGLKLWEFRHHHDHHEHSKRRRR